jgi:4,5-dihydroxyphthalate decarboxylase
MKLVLGRDDLAAAALSAAREAGAQPERADITPVHKASRGFVNRSAADLCELAIVTVLQAVAHGKPVLLLPVTTLGRHQHQTLVTLRDLTVADVEGHSVGVRAWSQTTGVWMRGFLTEQYGIDLRRAHWTTYEGHHVEGAEDPSWVNRAQEGTKLPQDFLDGRVDFGIMGNELPRDDRIRTAIEGAREVAEQWSKDHGFIPVNHVVGISEAAAAEHRDAVLAAYDALRAVLDAQEEGGPFPLHPVGFDALRPAFTQAAAYALDQDVIPRAVDYDELVDRSCAALGVPPSRLGG